MMSWLEYGTSIFPRFLQDHGRLGWKAILPVLAEENSCHLVFVTPKKDFCLKDQVWFTRGPIGRKILQTYTKLLAKDVPALKGKKITNKTRQGGVLELSQSTAVPIAGTAAQLISCLFALLVDEAPPIPALPMATAMTTTAHL